MHERRIPEWVRHAPAPSVAGFGVLTALDSGARAILLSVFPLAMYRVFGDADTVSAAYFAIGALSLTAGLLTPFATTIAPRRWVFTCGVALYLVSGALGIFGEAALGPTGAVAASVLSYYVAAVVSFTCLNAYVLDYVAQAQLGRCETLRMFYSALSWTIGPLAGVWLASLWAPAPFLVSALFALCLLGVFWRMRLGDGKLIRKARAPAPNPLAYLGRFMAQPRLVAGWLFAVLRSCGWWVYVVYLPIYAVQSGLDPRVGGAALSITNAFLFVAPLMLAWMQRGSVRRAVRIGFFCAGAGFLAAAATAGSPWTTVTILFVASTFMILLDICAGLPFLMAVKPSERTEMSAVYSSFRDVSAILTPGAAWLVLLVFNLPAVFAAGGLGLLGAWAIASRLHPRLGRPRKPVLGGAGAIPVGQGAVASKQSS